MCELPEIEAYLSEYIHYLNLGYENQLSNNFRRNDSLDYIASHLADLWEDLSVTQRQLARQHSDRLYAEYRRSHKAETLGYSTI